MEYITATDAQGKEVKLPLTNRAVEFFRMVNPVELPEKCPHCEYQSVGQGRTFEFATITVRRGQQQETMVDGFKCAKCGRRIDISHCNINLGG